jgi:hypothetical protein
MGVRGQRHAPDRALPRGEDLQNPLDRRLGGPQSSSGHRCWDKNPLPLPEIEPRSSNPYSDIVRTELPRLLHNKYSSPNSFLLGWSNKGG